MSALSQSYKYCRQLARDSHSNFYTAFHLLSGKRRMAMDALYAFARIADDSSDGDDSSCNTPDSEWSASHWHDWVKSLGDTKPSVFIRQLDPIRLALADSVQQFAIPHSVLHDMIDGIDFDLNPASQISSWQELRLYCHRVASSVGLGCLAIWLPSTASGVTEEMQVLARECGIAFQLTNILRDVIEDAGRGRCYIPAEDLERFGFNREQWTRSLLDQSSEKGAPHSHVLKVCIERAKGHFERGALLSPFLCLEGQRMFSLMWRTYLQILEAIDTNPQRVFVDRIRINKVNKVRLVLSHFFTPLYRPIKSATQSNESKTFRGEYDVARTRRVAIVGGGLAGCNAAMHLARHGVSVDLFEARSRLGGRIGSFFDRKTNAWVDYCQHVGMNCCSELKRWIADTGQANDWELQETLHFLGPRGKKIPIRSLPFPAPFHLAGLLLRWPGLTLFNRVRVAFGLNALTKLEPVAAHDSQLAIDWLRSHWQNDACLASFWETILVSALGEKLSRVTLGAMRKVLVDGFAKHRDAYHLLVPKKPLAELSDRITRDSLEALKVSVHDKAIITKLEKGDDRKWGVSTNEKHRTGYDAVVIAVPWHQISKVLPEGFRSDWSPESMQSSPITGVHTWWDRPWLEEPHGIFVEGLCQWVFPGNLEQPKSEGELSYYQIVISASQELRNEEPDVILKRVVEELRTAYPASSQASLVRGKIVTDPQAVFSVSPDAEPHRWQSDQFGDEELFVAGDWTNTGWPATMEGALRSGARAAECVMRAFGIPVVILSKR